MASKSKKITKVVDEEIPQQEKVVQDSTKEAVEETDFISRAQNLSPEEQRKMLEEEMAKNPQIREILSKLKEIGMMVKQIGSWLNGKSVLPEEVSHEEHAKFLATRYCYDVIFLLEQLGVLQYPAEQASGELSQQDEASSGEPSLIQPSSRVEKKD